MKIVCDDPDTGHRDRVLCLAMTTGCPAYQSQSLPNNSTIGRFDQIGQKNVDQPHISGQSSTEVCEMEDIVPKLSADEHNTCLPVSECLKSNNNTSSQIQHLTDTLLLLGKNNVTIQSEQLEKSTTTHPHTSLKTVDQTTSHPHTSLKTVDQTNPHPHTSLKIVDQTTPHHHPTHTTCPHWSHCGQSLALFDLRQIKLILQDMMVQSAFSFAIPSLTGNPLNLIDKIDSLLLSWK